MSFRDELEAAEGDAQAEKLAVVRRDRDSLRRERDRLAVEKAELEKLVGFTTAYQAADTEPPEWLTPKKSKAGHRATLVAMLSDTHFDEVVDPARMGGVNAYDRDIATQRLRRFAERTVMLSRDYSSGVKFDGLVLALGGDVFSGDIHEELRRSNEDSMLGSVLYWQEQLEATIAMLAEEFGRVHVRQPRANHRKAVG